MDAKTISWPALTATIFILFLTETAQNQLTPQTVLSPIIILGGIRLLQIILILLLFYYFPLASRGYTSTRPNLSNLGLGADQILSGACRGILWSAGFGVAALIGFGILFWVGRNPIQMLHSRLPEGRIELIQYFIVGGLIAPVTEELVFRGVLYGFLRRWGAPFAVIASTMIFSVAHSGVSPVQVIGGLIFAVAYEREHKLMTPITIHALANMALFSLSAFL